MKSGVREADVQPVSDLNSGDMRAQHAEDAARALRAQASELVAQAEAAERRSQVFAKGAAGERDIGNLLDGLLVEGWIALHDRRVTGSSPANLDHLVVGPAGAFVIDTKNWTGGRVRLDDRGMALAKWRKDDELHAVKVQGDVLAASVQQARPGTPVHAVLAFVQDMGIDRPTLHQSVVVLQRDQLIGWLRALPPSLTPGEVVALLRELERRHPPRSVRVPSRPGSRGRSSTPARTRTSSPRGPQPSRRGAASQLQRQSQRRALLIKLLVVVVLFFVLTQTTLLTTVVGTLGKAAGGAISEQVGPQPPTPPPSR